MPTKSQAAIFRQTVKSIGRLKEIALSLNKGDSKMKVEFNARYKDLQNLKQKLENLYCEILDDDGLSDDTERFYTTGYENALSDYYEILTVAETVSVEVSTLSSAVLPKIELPKFSSLVEDWPSFITIFKSLTDDMASLTDAVKLHYLISSLSGEALSMISHLKITNENYNVALDILKRRYENRRVLIDRFVDIILGLPQIHIRLEGPKRMSWRKGGG